jgi:hypothetical protein
MSIVKPWSYWFSDGTNGCVMAETKAHAISTIMELNPSQPILFISPYIWNPNGLRIRIANHKPSTFAQPRNLSKALE